MLLEWPQFLRCQQASSIFLFLIARLMELSRKARYITKLPKCAKYISLHWAIWGSKHPFASCHWRAVLRHCLSILFYTFIDQSMSHYPSNGYAYAAIIPLFQNNAIGLVYDRSWRIFTCLIICAHILLCSWQPASSARRIMSVLLREFPWMRQNQSIQYCHLQLSPSASWQQFCGCIFVRNFDFIWFCGLGSSHRPLKGWYLDDAWSQPLPSLQLW